ncbi:MAG: hypothetical protein HYZ81_24370 [Nitrospinae bacterium]|nr:hypothetical protein [Nitrospinota bacterium]
MSCWTAAHSHRNNCRFGECYRWGLLALFVWSLVGCGPTLIRLEEPTTIQKGVTTQEQIQREFGKPSHIEPTRDGGDVWLYYAEPLVENRTTALAIKFTREGQVVEDYYFAKIDSRIGFDKFAIGMEVGEWLQKYR